MFLKPTPRLLLEPRFWAGQAWMYVTALLTKMLSSVARRNARSSDAEDAAALVDPQSRASPEYWCEALQVELYLNTGRDKLTRRGQVTASLVRSGQRRQELVPIASGRVPSMLVLTRRRSPSVYEPFVSHG
ncbi:unnamed protein product [Fusarium langsethiae]|nr:unnamed protein product [Fusarium langsethiae]